MNRRIGEVGKSSHVVEVEVGLDDVPHVARVEAEGFDLPDGGELRIAGRPRVPYVNVYPRRFAGVT